MQSIQTISENTIYVGASDRRLAKFENLFPIPRGVSYNAYVMYNSVIWPIVESIFVQLGIHWSMIYAINDVIPSIVVAVLLIAFGGRLLGFGKHAHHNDTDDLPPYQG